MLVLGGALKRREKISARLGDVLSQLYLCSAILKRYEDEGRQAADLPLMHWAMQDGLYKIQTAFEGLCSNFPNRVVGILMRIFVLPLGGSFSPPNDYLGHQVARLLMEPGASRDRHIWREPPSPARISHCRARRSAARYWPACPPQTGGCWCRPAPFVRRSRVSPSRPPAADAVWV